MIEVGARPAGSQGCFRHEAWFYDGEDEFAAGAAAFVSEGLEADESVLVVVRPHQIDRLRNELDGQDVSRVLFADMAELGANPARLIPTWTQFVERRPPGCSALRGIGEPIWARRSPAELVESHRHEELLNLAFAGTRDFWLRCPYDVGALDPAVIERARRTHPLLHDHDGPRASATYAGIGACDLSGEPLPAPPTSRRELDIALEALSGLRRFAAESAAQAGFDEDRTAEFVLVLSELASNSVLHGGGQGTLAVWADGDGLTAEARDRGHIRAPLVGREVPGEDQEGGWGLWLVNQLCDLVQIRSGPEGTVVRVHLRREPGSRP